MSEVRWSAKEVEDLKTYYPVYGPQWDGWAELLPRRVGTSIRCKAHKLGIASPGKRIPWTEAEREIIAEYFPVHGPSWCGWAVVLPERSVRAIGCEALRMGVTCDAAEVEAPWTDAERRRLLVDVNHMTDYTGHTFMECMEEYFRLWRMHREMNAGRKG